MRTTITLEPDVEALLKQAMHQRGLNFKDAVNDAIRRGLGRAPTRSGRSSNARSTWASPGST